MGSAFIHSTVCQSTALTAHHPNKGEHVCGFHSSQQKLPLEARCLRPHEALSLFIPVTFHQGHQRQKWPPVPEGKASSLHAQASLPTKKQKILRQTRDSYDMAAVGMAGQVEPGRIDTSLGPTCWVWWRLEVKSEYPKHLEKDCGPKIWIRR